MRSWVAGLLALLCLAGCSSKSPSASTPPKPPPVDPWVITNLDPHAGTPALLWNGLIGVRVGTGGGSGGPMFLISQYQKEGEEKIQPLPNPLDGDWTASANGATAQLDPKKGSGFKQTLNLKDGCLTSNWTQDVSGVEVKVQVETSVHPKELLIDQMWTFQSNRFVELSYRGGMGVEGATGSWKEVIYSLPGFDRTVVEQDAITESAGLYPDNVKRGVSWSFKNELYVASAADSGKPLVFRRLIHPLPQKGPLVRRNVFLMRPDARPQTEKQWQTDIEIDGPVEDQQFVRSALFYLRGAVHPDGRMSVSPMGLSSDIYNGHVFWDADIWVFPALALIDPARAKAIPQYRLAKLEQAHSNFWAWIGAERPMAVGKMGFVELRGMLIGVKFPWESSVTGKETVPGPSQFQDHITGSVAWSVSQASALGLVPDKVQERAASFYRQRSTSASPHELLSTMSPDEHHTGHNDLYTNLLAMWCTSGGKWPAKPTYKLPKDDKTFLTYDNDGLRSYKQAAAVLSIYPLQYPSAEAQAKQMMERFSDKVIKNGPAMTDSIHALIWARLGEKDKAYKAWHDSWQPFVKPPFLLFSEKRNSSRTYFTTGAAGSLQAVLYGFAGLRIDDKKAPNAQWSMPLKGGKVLSIAPCLPKEWKKLTLRNLTILGKRYTFEIVGDKVKVIS